MRTFLAGSMPGTTVHTATSGQEALRMMETFPIDLVVSDYKMPGMDGLELLQRARKAAPDIPRVLMTAFPDMDLAIQALNEDRIQHFLTKPLEPDMLRDVLKALLEERRARRMRDAALKRSLEEMKRRRPPA
jgi:CheY-like chemotaxis protein